MLTFFLLAIRGRMFSRLQLRDQFGTCASRSPGDNGRFGSRVARNSEVRRQVTLYFLRLTALSACQGWGKGVKQLIIKCFKVLQEEVQIRSQAVTATE